MLILRSHSCAHTHPPGDALLRPQVLKTLPFTLNRLTVSLQPSLEKFESQLLQLINADCCNTVRPLTHTHITFIHTHTALLGCYDTAVVPATSLQAYILIGCVRSFLFWEKSSAAAG